jgi:hypothetical protein
MHLASPFVLNVDEKDADSLIKPAGAVILCTYTEHAYVHVSSIQTSDAAAAATAAAVSSPFSLALRVLSIRPYYGVYI